jgi:Fur family peroxide stress response transcriptional regulator
MSHRTEQAIEKLRVSGVRMTPQRHAILSYLLDSMTHPSADDIYKALAKNFPNMSVATVYNNLKVFVETGLVRELTYGDNASRFEADMTEHYHAICEQCGKIDDFEYPPFLDVEIKAAELTKFQISGHRMEVYGTCENCITTKH